MKRFIEGADRGQATLFPERLDNYVGEDANDALYGDFDDVNDLGINPGSADNLTGGGGTDFMFGGRLKQL